MQFCQILCVRDRMPGLTCRRHAGCPGPGGVARLSGASGGGRQAVSGPGYGPDSCPAQDSSARCCCSSGGSSAARVVAVPVSALVVALGWGLDASLVVVVVVAAIVVPVLPLPLASVPLVLVALLLVFVLAAGLLRIGLVAPGRAARTLLPAARLLPSRTNAVPI